MSEAMTTTAALAPSVAASFRQRRVLITGGTRGIGLEAACLAAGAGARVALTYRRSEDDAEVAAARVASHGAAPEVFKGDVADNTHVPAVVKGLVGKWGGIDVLFNCAALNQMYPLALIDEADWDEVIAVNLKGAFLFSRAVAKHMIKARAGSILNFGSFASERIIESPAHYAASKSGLRGLTESMAFEVGRYNVRVNLLAPGVLQTGLSSMLPQHRLSDYLEQSAAGRVATAAELARFALFIASDENSFMTGAKIALDGGL
jgi:3-oxoacyl-[acyl-carrier protein] reductase